MKHLGTELYFCTKEYPPPSTLTEKTGMGLSFETLKTDFLRAALKQGSPLMQNGYNYRNTWKRNFSTNTVLESVQTAIRC